MSNRVLHETIAIAVLVLIVGACAIILAALA
jgi:hypothetical protein